MLSKSKCVESIHTFRELKRNSTRSGKYIWFKAYDKAMERRKRSTHNAALAPEFAARKLITKYLGAVVYFADPYASWQKGTIENTNSSDSIFQNKPTLMKLQIKRLRAYKRK